MERKKGQRLLDYLGDLKLVGGAFGSIRESLILRKTRTGFIRTQHIIDRHGMRGWFHAVKVVTSQRIDVSEDAIELGGVAHGFVFSKSESSQGGYVMDIDLMGCRHGRTAFLPAGGSLCKQKAQTVASLRLWKVD